MENKSGVDAYQYFQKIQNCSGRKFINKLHSRSFSLNTFQINSLELLEATKKIRDPDLGLPLMSEGNREAGVQAHREINRYIHNFVASAKTLVDHTRVFMEEEYSGQSVMAEYLSKVKGALANEPVVKFVHDLRNYMLHKGLPNSQMFIELKNFGDTPDTGFQCISGVRFGTNKLLEWSGWTAPAKRYLEDSGEYLEIHRFTEEYLACIEDFQAWLDKCLRGHHAKELEELSDLERLYAEALKAQASAADEVSLEQKNDVKLSVEAILDEDSFNNLNDICEALASSMTRVFPAAQVSDSFKTQRPVKAVINDGQIIGSVVRRDVDSNGDRILAFLQKDGVEYGFLSPGIKILEEVKDLILCGKVAREKISREFLEKELLEWSRKKFLKETDEAFSDALLSASTNAVKDFEVWIPVAHLEVESNVDFGKVKICPLSVEKVDEFESMGVKASPAQKDAIRQLFQKLREDIQGYAAIVIKVESESSLASKVALKIAQDAVDLLRFFSPAAFVSWKLCPTALLGSDILPRTKTVAVSESSIVINESMLAQDVEFWKLSEAAAKKLESSGFQLAGRLIDKKELSDFSAAIRSSIIAYSKGTTKPDLTDRLFHVVAALEQLFLKHEVEPIVPSISRRVSNILSRAGSERSQISDIIRRAYQIKDKHRSLFHSQQEGDILQRFIQISYSSIITALLNSERFLEKSDFLNALDAL